jgi:hypothetical protein
MVFITITTSLWYPHGASIRISIPAYEKHEYSWIARSLARYPFNCHASYSLRDARACAHVGLVQVI